MEKAREGLLRSLFYQDFPFQDELLLMSVVPEMSLNGSRLILIRGTELYSSHQVILILGRHLFGISHIQPQPGE